MGITPTPRLGLKKQAGGDPVAIAPINDSFDLLDKQVGTYVYTGPLVPPTVIPDGIPVYNGLIVVEDATGISYQVIKSGNTWRKQFIQYPWYIAAEGHGQAGFTSDTTFSLRWINTFVEGKNSTAADLVNNRIKIPVTGNYIVSAKVSWPANQNGSRALATEQDQDQGDMRYGDVGHSTVTQVSTLMQQSAGTQIGIVVWQDSGVTLAPNFVRCRAALITPW